VIRLRYEESCAACGYRQSTDEPESSALLGSPGPVGDDLRAVLDVAPIVAGAGTPDEWRA
jgi:hypothetical protein